MLKLIQILAILATVSLLSACGGSDTTTNDETSNNFTPPPPSNQKSINLTWSPPSTRADGSYLPPSNLAGYRIYMGTSNSNLKPLVDLMDDEITKYTVDNLAAGSYYFSVSAYDTDGLESGLSQIVLVHLG